MNSYILTHDGNDWSLKHQQTRRVVERFQCRRKALQQSLRFAHNQRASLVLMPGGK